MISDRRKGLPRDLELETYNAVRPIFLKYSKFYMSRDRVVGIMLDAFRQAMGRDQAEGVKK